MRALYPQPTDAQLQIRSNKLELRRTLEMNLQFTLTIATSRHARNVGSINPPRPVRHIPELPRRVHRVHRVQESQDLSFPAYWFLEALQRRARQLCQFKASIDHVAISVERRRSLLQRLFNRSGLAEFL